jgi:hypothetical protein
MSDLRHIHDPVLSSLKMEGIRFFFGQNTYIYSSIHIFKGSPSPEVKWQARRKVSTFLRTRKTIYIYIYILILNYSVPRSLLNTASSHHIGSGGTDPHIFNFDAGLKKVIGLSYRSLLFCKKNHQQLLKLIHPLP